MTTPTDAREQARHKASVMIAFAEGKEIEFKGKNENDLAWMTVPDPTWQNEFYDYRVKPEERKPREVVLWVNDEDPSMRLSCPIFRPTAGAWRQAVFVEKVLPETETE